MKRLTRSAWIAALVLAVNAAFAQSDPGGASRGPLVRTADTAAGRVVSTVYDERFSWVRIQSREAGAAPNQHPFDVTPAALRAMLERIQLLEAKPTPLFTAKQLDEIAAPLATALGRASAEQDVTFAVSDRLGTVGPFGSRAVTTARAFRRDGQLQVIVGMMRREFESQFRGTGVLITFEPGQRANPVERGFKLGVAAGSGSLVRDDWIALSTSVDASAATPAAAGAPAGAAGATNPTMPAAVPAPAAKDGDALYRNTAERLRALERLRKDGLISEAEYLEKRRQILLEI